MQNVQNKEIILSMNTGAEANRISVKSWRARNLECEDGQPLKDIPNKPQPEHQGLY